MKALGVFGDFYHDKLTLQNFFAAAGRELKWTIADPRSDWGVLEEYDVIVLGAENRVSPETSAETWMTASQAQTLVRYVESGGKLLAFHAGMASYPADGAYTALIGGAFQFHPKTHARFGFVPKEALHPLLEGVEPFEVTDEMYFVWRDPQSTQLLATVESEEYGTSSALWYGRRGRGTVVGFTIGHRAETLANPMILRVAANALSWLCRGAS